nr:peptidyl-prolyl cis-trans isomerase Pin1 [Ipomoea batatas]
MYNEVKRTPITRNEIYVIFFIVATVIRIFVLHYLLVAEGSKALDGDVETYKSTGAGIANTEDSEGERGIQKLKYLCRLRLVLINPGKHLVNLASSDDFSGLVKKDQGDVNVNKHVRSQMQKSFVTATYSRKVGETSDTVDTDISVHIIKQTG